MNMLMNKQFTGNKIAAAISLLVVLAAGVASKAAENNARLGDFRVRDPFVFADSASGLYYLFYTSGGNVYCRESRDLANWSGFRRVFANGGRFEETWAPEIHFYNGSYYMIVSLKVAGQKRGCYILRADAPGGPYTGNPVRLMPDDLWGLDGTLYVDESGTPYLVYCQGWKDFPDGNGGMRAVELTKDLMATAGEHKMLFRARDNTYSADGVTDAPFLYRAKNGDLVMLWSKYNNSRQYAIVSARSKNGIFGPWTQDAGALFTDNGGHAMVFRDFTGQNKIAFHSPNTPSGSERASICNFVDQNGVLSIDQSGVTVASTISLPVNGEALLGVPSAVNSIRQIVLSANVRAMVPVDHSGWVNSVNLSVSGTDRAKTYGFNLVYGNSATSNRVQLYRADQDGLVYNKVKIPRNQPVNLASFEKLFSPSGLDVRLVRKDRMAYLLANLDGKWERSGAWCSLKTRPRSSSSPTGKLPWKSQISRLQSGVDSSHARRSWQWVEVDGPAPGERVHQQHGCFGRNNRPVTCRQAPDADSHSTHSTH